MTKSPVIKPLGYSRADLAAVSDNPEWTDATAAMSKSFDETFPGLARQRGGEPRKTQVTLQLDQRVVDHFKATGDGWQNRMNEALVKAAGL